MNWPIWARLGWSLAAAVVLLYSLLANAAELSRGTTLFRFIGNVLMLGWVIYLTFADFDLVWGSK